MKKEFLSFPSYPVNVPLNLSLFHWLEVQDSKYRGNRVTIQLTPCYSPAYDSIIEHAESYERNNDNTCCAARQISPSGQAIEFPDHLTSIYISNITMKIASERRAGADRVATSTIHFIDRTLPYLAELSQSTGTARLWTSLHMSIAFSNLSYHFFNPIRDSGDGLTAICCKFRRPRCSVCTVGTHDRIGLTWGIAKWCANHVSPLMWTFVRIAQQQLDFQLTDGVVSHACMYRCELLIYFCSTQSITTNLQLGLNIVCHFFPN
jgi:hypothetical protein